MIMQLVHATEIVEVSEQRVDKDLFISIQVDMIVIYATAKKISIDIS